MSDLISRSALLKSYDIAKMVEYDETGCGVTRIAIPVQAIKDAPTIDAVPVVRCRDCQEIEPCVAVNDGYSWCNRWGTVVSLDGFCHKGAKMDGIYDAMKKLQQELPDYIKTLDSVTPERKAALLNGDWDPPDTNKE